MRFVRLNKTTGGEVDVNMHFVFLMSNNPEGGTILSFTAPLDNYGNYPIIKVVESRNEIISLCYPDQRSNWSGFIS